MEKEELRMKKYVLLTLMFVLSIGFSLGNGAVPVTAAEKAKYGGILKVAISKSPRAFGYPPKIRAADQEVAGPAWNSWLEPPDRTLQSHTWLRAGKYLPTENLSPSN